MRRPGRSRAHERQRQNRVSFVRYSGADKPRRGGVFPRGDSPGGRLAPDDVKTPVNSTAIQNHGPSHRPSSTSFTESPLRGSAGVPLTCIAGRNLLLPAPPHACAYCCVLRLGTKREPGGPCPAARARASRRRLSVNVSVPRRSGRVLGFSQMPSHSPLCSEISSETAGWSENDASPMRDTTGGPPRIPMLHRVSASSS